MRIPKVRDVVAVVGGAFTRATVERAARETKAKPRTVEAKVKASKVCAIFMVVKMFAVVFCVLAVGKGCEDEVC